MSNLRGFFCDDETGEVICYRINDETGEPVIEDNVVPVCLTSKERDKKPESKKYMKFPKCYMAKTKKFQSLKANIIAGSNPISFRMLLIIPTVAIFPALLCIMLFILEIFLHINCHRKNKQMKNTNLFYRSPFHVVTSIFCASCRESQSSSKVGQLQDQRRYRYDYIRNIAL